jgi:hypothetical protein
MAGMRTCVLAILVTIFQLMGSPAMSEPECDFVKIARDFIITKFPQTDFSYYRHPVLGVGQLLGSEV